MNKRPIIGIVCSRLMESLKETVRFDSEEELNDFSLDVTNNFKEKIEGDDVLDTLINNNGISKRRAMAVVLGMLVAFMILITIKQIDIYHLRKENNELKGVCEEYIEITDKALYIINKVNVQNDSLMCQMVALEGSVR